MEAASNDDFRVVLCVMVRERDREKGTQKNRKYDVGAKNRKTIEIL